MKRMIAALLTVFMLFTLAACGVPAPEVPEDTQPPAPVVTNAPESPSAPTAEQQKILDEARELGILDDSISGDMNAAATEKDVVTLLRNAYVNKYGTDFSSVLDELSASASATKEATRIFAAMAMYDARIQYALGKSFDSYEAFETEKNAFSESESGRWNLYLQNGIIAEKADGSVGLFELDTDCADFAEIEGSGGADAVRYATITFDRRTEENLMRYDENRCFHPLDGMTVYEAMELAYRFYYSLEPVPQYVDVSEVGTYSKDIITDELLARAPALPAASNEKLPAWKGFNRQFMTTMMGSGDEGNYWVTEAEIKAMAETGANFLRLWISFSAFEAPAYGDKNQVNTYYLEHLDEILSWCIENRIHLQVSVVNGPGLNCETRPEDEKELSDGRFFRDEAYRAQCLEWYRMLARRYAEISNENFSINLLNEPESAENDEQYAAAFAPIIDAIWQESPNRLIVADVNENITGEAMAKLGVALSCHIYRPYDMMTVFRDEDAAAVESTVWPAPYLPSILYSADGASWYGYPDNVWKSGNKITGDISGTLELMASDISFGSAVLQVKADGRVLYEETPPYEIEGDDKENDRCYSKEPLIVEIPEETKELEISCAEGIIALSEITVNRTDGVSVSITCVSDEWGGEEPGTVDIAADGTYTGEQVLTAERVLSTRYGGAPSVMETKALADKCGVGFMMGEFGIYGDFYLDFGMSNETVSAIYKDFVKTFDEAGMPWAANWLVDRYSVAIAYPFYSDRSYRTLSGSAFYVDEYMFDLFKGLILE